MSFRSWLLLLVIYVLYLVLGGFAFRALENPADCDKKEQQREKEDDVRRKIAQLQGERDD